MGKSGGEGTTLYDYYGTIAGGLCIGPVQGICSIILNGQEAWPLGLPWFVGLGCVAGKLYVFDAQTWTCTTPHTASLANAPGSGLEGWTQYYFAYHGSDSDDFNCYDNSGVFQGVVRIYWGTQTQPVDFYLQSANNDGGIKGNLGSGDTHPPYLGLCYCVLVDFLLGEEVQSGPNVEIVVRRQPNQALMTGGAAGITDGQANIASVLCEVLTDENCLGLPTTMIDSTSFQAVANWLDGNGGNYNVSVLIDSSETLRSFLDKILVLLDGWIRFNPTTQKIELGVYEHGVAPPTYANAVTLTADCLTKIPKFDTTSWQGTFSRATVRYNSRQITYQQTSVYADDARAFFVLGSCRDQALDRPYITREGQALFHGRETLRVIGHAQMTGTLEVRREFARAIRSGDFVFVDIDLEPNGSTVFQYFRVTQRHIPPTGPMTLDLLADNTLAAVPFSTPYPITPPGTSNVPALTQTRCLQVPQTLSGEFDAVLFLAVRPNNLIAGCQVFFDTSRVLSTTVVSIISDGTGNFGIITFTISPGFAVNDFIDVSVSGTPAFNASLAQVTAVNVGAKTVTYALAAPMTPSTAGSGAITVADYFTTFSSIGTFPTFAAFATVNTAIGASDASIKLNVDTTQADAEYFTSQFSSNDANDDTMLAIIISLVSAGADAGQIAESSGFAIFEICSVSTQTLISAGVYQLSVLRGRQGTTAAAFTTAHTEVWLIPRAVLQFFINGMFDVIRANRILNTIPQYAQFRYCPFTFAGQLALSSATNHQVRFPLKSITAPSLVLTTPLGTSLTYGGATMPYRLEVAGTWTDVENNLVDVKINLRLAGESSDRVIADFQIPQTGSYSFDKFLIFDKPGSWTIKLIARDANNLQTEVDISLNITGGAPTCAIPELFDSLGNLVINANGDYTYAPTKSIAAITGLSNVANSPNVFGYLAQPVQMFPFGPWSLVCTTPASTIFFFTKGIIFNGTKLVESAQLTWTQYIDGNEEPFHYLIKPTTVVLSAPTQSVSGVVTAQYSMAAYATAPGYADSPVIEWVIPLFI